MSDKGKESDRRPLADRRAKGNDTPPNDEPDFAEEHTPSETDPSQAHESPVGGQDEGYEPPTRA